jgi:hypothetical protein
MPAFALQPFRLIAAAPTWLNSPGVILLAAGLLGLVGLWLDLLLPPPSHGIERGKIWTAYGGVVGLGVYVGLQLG